VKNLFKIAEFIKTADPNDFKPKPTSKSRSNPATQGVVPTSIQSPIRSQANYAPEVKTMQEAIRSFAASVTNYSATSTPQQKSQADSGKKAFNDFITENFVADNSKGVEWTTDKKVTTIPDKQKTQTGLYEQHVVVNGWERIGMPKAEVTPDGVWGPRSQMALKNIAAFAKALIEVEKRFTSQESKDFTSQDIDLLETVSEINPKTDIDPKTKIVKHTKSTLGTWAQWTVGVITKLDKYYKIFLQKTLTNPKNAIFINQHDSLDGVKKKEQSIDENDKLLLAQVEQDGESSTPITVTLQLPGKPAPVTLSIPLFYLTNKKRFKEFLAQHKIASDDWAIKVLNDIQSQLSTLRQRV